MTEQRDRTNADAILATVETFLDTCPDLEDADLEIGQTFDFDATPGGRRMEVTIDGVLYAVTVEACHD